jgi:hypothetical protein
MKHLIADLFYGYKFKVVGACCIVWGLISFFTKHYRYEIWDINLLAALSCWGFCFIFFSKEKQDDERIHNLKFRALTWGLPVGLTITHLVNYIFFSAEEPDSGKYIDSISAYSSFAIIMIIALTAFYYLKYKEEQH